MAPKIGFLSFGHYGDYPGSKTRTGADMLHQAIDLAVGAEDIGLDGAFYRVHHFAQQQMSPFPLLAAAAARTSTIELGTGVIDMRYENPLYMAEQAAMVDLIAGNERLQLGISRGSPETVYKGFAHFGYLPAEGEDESDMARRHTALFREAIAGKGIAQSVSDPTQLDPITPQSPGLPGRIWWGAGTRDTARWTGEQGMNLMSSTLLLEDTGVPFDQLQSEQLRIFKQAWADAGHEGTPRTSVSRSIIPIIDEQSNYYFGLRAQAEGQDQVGILDGAVSRFGKSYIGEPDKIAEELAQDEAVAEADTLLVTIPNMLGVDFNLRQLQAIVRDIKPAL